ncbi:hypothetical protein NKDENANG_03068 [Candidatus Entotheonellaceae bacterium PAL068K]
MRDFDTLGRCLAEADGVFVGSCLKTEDWNSRVDVDCAREYVNMGARLI